MDLDRFPKFPLINAPTPLQRARNLERKLGDQSPRIYIKRDDLTGLAFGGNKARKLEFLVGDALRQGADVLVTEGAAQSNHARMTAAAAALAGLGCVLILDARHGTAVQGNLLLDHLLGAEVRIAATREDRRRMMTSIGDELLLLGKRPYVISTGGSVPVGALGYVAFAAELDQQLQHIGERPSGLYFATSSNGTHAGLAAGGKAVDASWRPLGIAVQPSAEVLATESAQLATATASLAGLPFQFRPDDMAVDDRFYGEDYAIPTAAGMEAILLFARTEAIILDPVYTGKAASGFIAVLNEGKYGPDDVVVFLHTGGGPSIFAAADLLASWSTAGPSK